MTTASAAETEALGRRLGEHLAPPALVLLRGGLGAGKTCFVRGLARGLDVPEDEPVTSPTYALMNHYRGRCDLYHFDLYRLVGVDDLEEIGFYEFVQARGIVVVEWSERADDLDLGGLRIDIAAGADEENRIITFSAEEPCYVSALDGLPHD